MTEIPPVRPTGIEHHFVNRLTHDLRVPFAAVRSALYLLERHGQQISGPREKKWLEAAGSSLNTFERLLRAVDIHVNTLTYVCSSTPSCNLHEVVKSSLALASDEHPGTRPLLSWDPKVAHLQPVDGNMIASSLRQLLDNAVQHSPVGKQPEVQIRSMQNGWEIAVINEGPAIPENEYPKLFTPFFHSQSHLGEQGPGLGLSTASIAATKAGCSLSYERNGARSLFLIRHQTA